jgi:uncharacterized protein YprB with RNaseH-like and TPR domain
MDTNETTRTLDKFAKAHSAMSVIIDCHVDLYHGLRRADHSDVRQQYGTLKPILDGYDVADAIYDHYRSIVLGG